MRGLQEYQYTDSIGVGLDNELEWNSLVPDARCKVDYSYKI